LLNFYATMKKLLTWVMMIGLFSNCAVTLTAQEAKTENDEFADFLGELRTMSPLERKKQLLEVLSFQALGLGGDVVDHVPIPNRLVAPSVLNGGDAGWAPGLDSESTLTRLFPTNAYQKESAEKVILGLAILLKDSPDEAFRWMAPRTISSVPSVGDVVKVLALTERQPGAPLTQSISKERWTQFYNSSNPCYKIVALEKYDSTAQSPEELLKLYRECLFETFGYLQVRALEGIYRSKDYRPEVRDLLKEFLASSPVEDDGTLPAFPANFSNPVEGARWLLAEMEKARAGAQAPSVTPVASKPPVPKAPKAKEEQKPAGNVSGEPKELASVPWNSNILIIWNVVATAGVIVLLVLVLKRRKTS
jgi:hypothetical protein